MLFSATFQSVPGSAAGGELLAARGGGHGGAGPPGRRFVDSHGQSRSRRARCTAIGPTRSTFALAKILKFGQTRTQVGLDVYNVLNSSAVLSYNQAYILSGAWLTPNSVITGRFAKISAQFDF